MMRSPFFESYINDIKEREPNKLCSRYNDSHDRGSCLDTCILIQFRSYDDLGLQEHVKGLLMTVYKP